MLAAFVASRHRLYRSRIACPRRWNKYGIVVFVSFASAVVRSRYA